MLFSSVSGALADRLQRKTLLLWEGVLSGAVSGGLALATYFDVATLGLAIGLAFLIGCLRAVRFTATNRIVYDLVGPQQLVNGISLWRLSTTPMMTLGAMLAGALLERPGIWAAYAFMGISLVAAMPFLVMVRVRGVVERPTSGLLQQTVDGLRYAAGNQALRTLFTVSVAMESLGFAFLVMIPVMAKTVLEVGGTGLGFMQAGVGAGMLVANVVMAARGDSENKPRIIYMNAFAAGLALIAFALS